MKRVKPKRLFTLQWMVVAKGDARGPVPMLICPTRDVCDGVAANHDAAVVRIAMAAMIVPDDVDSLSDPRCEEFQQ